MKIPLIGLFYFPLVFKRISNSSESPLKHLHLEKSCKACGLKSINNLLTFFYRLRFCAAQLREVALPLDTKVFKQVSVVLFGPDVFFKIVHE